MAMLGSLADTALDLVASLVTLWGVRIAAQPADSDHRFGHGKAEALVGAGPDRPHQPVGGRHRCSFDERLIAGAQTAGCGTRDRASRWWRWPRRLALILYQRTVIRRTGSMAIATDRLHYSSDLLLNGSVIAALVLEQYVGWRGSDAALGLLIAAWLGFGAWRSSSQAINQLMDREWPEEERATFLAAAAEYPELAGLHDLRTRTSGTHHFAQFHVWVPARLDGARGA